MRRTRDPANGPSDESLLAGIAHGDERAGLMFVRRYQARVFGLAFGMVADAALAEDIAQEALMRAWRHAPVYDPRRGAVSTWVLTIARNLTIDALRMRRAVPTDPDDLINLGLASNEASPEGAAVSCRCRPRPSCGAGGPAHRAAPGLGARLLLRDDRGRDQRGRVDPARHGQDADTGRPHAGCASR